jgi:hypothetical protein
VSLGDLWVKSMNLVWLGVSSGGVDNTSSGSLSSWLGIELNIFVLDEMEFISFHGDIFSKIFKSEERRTNQVVYSRRSPTSSPQITLCLLMRT